MTLAEREALVAAFSLIVEDYVSATNRRFYMDDGSAIPDDGRVEVTGIPWESTAAVLAAIPESKRTPYLTVNVAGVEYWFNADMDLVEKVGDLSLADKAVTLAKMADMATASVIYRKTAGTGVPEVQSLDTLRTDLAIPAAVDLALYVLKVSGYSLVADTEIAKIHEAESDNQDLSNYVEKAEGERLITESEATILSALPNNFTIYLPNSSTVAGRIAAAVEGTDYPTGWILEAGGNPNDLVITHTLGRKVADLKVWSAGEGDTLLWFNEAYSLLIATTEAIAIGNLATIATPIYLYLIFA